MRRKMISQVCFLMSLVFILGSTMSFASGARQEYWPLLKTTDKYKSWNIEFNYPLDPETINYDNILLRDENRTNYLG